jgi:hypothetical protein
MSPLNNEDVKEITSRLDTVIKLLAVICTREMTKQEAILRLDKMQLNREQIADAVGVNGHNVSQVLYASKKSAEKKGKKVSQPQDNSGSTPESEIVAPAMEAQTQ